VEFVVGKDQSFYFLEMNTRLQVEHPVTECITGLDLVELMIRVATGEKLGFTQAQIPRRGWAIECRINAEDPFRNFLPSTGRLVRFEPPAVTMEAARPVPGMDGGEWNLASIGGVRVDTGVEEGGQIPMHYDSMIAKLIVHGIDRQDAIRRMSEALNAFVIRGISSNIPFQSALLAHPRFISGDFNTGFIAEQFAQGFRAEDVAHDDPDFLLALAAAAHRRFLDRAAAISGQLPGHRVQVGSDVVVVVKGREGRHAHHPAQVTTSSGSITVEVGGRRYDLSGRRLFRGIRVLGECNGAPFAAQVERDAAGVWIRVAHNGRRIDAMVLYPRAAELQKLMPYKPPPDTSKLLLSPMPGLLASVTVGAGQKVHAGERRAVVEAMKMENILVALQDGVVAQVLARPGESLAVDQPILSFE
jgi:propionyl-CoA carboxylase alpha chain